MKIFKALASGFSRTLKTWKGILFMWLTSLLTVSLIAIPVKAFLKSGFGGSMITERFKDGLDIEALGDLGQGFRNMLASAPVTLLLLLIIGMLLYSFLTGGIFDTLKAGGRNFSGRDFFSACSGNFWSFLVIYLIIGLLSAILMFIAILLPVSLVAQADSGSETAIYNTVIIAISFYFIIMTILMLTADYARAWQVNSGKQACFTAIGFGFGRTFRTFLSSFPLMLILVIVQILFTMAVIMFIGRWKPVTGGGVFLMFILSQILFFVRCGLRVWRYGSVSSLMELKNEDFQKTKVTDIPNI